MDKGTGDHSHKTKSLFLRTLVITVLPVLMAIGVPAEARHALVVGNSVYGGSITTLVNPANDAADMGKLLAANGFAVTELHDQDYASFEAGLQGFSKKVSRGDTVVFFYAGHAVQVANENYLIPVKEAITSEPQIRSKSVSVAEVLDSFKTAGAGTCLLFLDACRDNPFTGASRSATRGLATVAPPKDMETLIAYATAPGETASDGDGRNGVFTQALLKNLAQDGVPITEAMTLVKADVVRISNGVQRPRVDDGLTRAFVLNDVATAATKAKAAADAANAEADLLAAQLEKARATLASVKNDTDRKTKELEVQAQEALLAQKQLIAENLVKEEQNRQLAVLQAQRLQAAREASAQDALKQQAATSAKADAMRRELDDLQKSGAQDSPDALVTALDALVPLEKSINAQFDQSIADVKAQIGTTWQVQIGTLSLLKKEPWESKSEFSARVLVEQTNFERQRDQEVQNALTGLEGTRRAQLAQVQARRNVLNNQLATKTWREEGSQVELVWGEFNDETKDWPWTITSKVPGLEWSDSGVVNLAGRNLARDYTALQAAIQSKSLSAWFEYQVKYQLGGWHPIALASYGVRNLTTKAALFTSRGQQTAAAFQSEGWAQKVSLIDSSRPLARQDNVRILLPDLPGDVILSNGRSTLTALVPRQNPPILQATYRGEAFGFVSLVPAGLLQASTVIDLRQTLPQDLTRQARDRRAGLAAEAQFKNTIGVSSWITGVLGLASAGAAVWAYSAGSATYLQYLATYDTDTAHGLNVQMQEQQSLFNGFLAAGTGLLGTALATWFIAQDLETDRRIQTLSLLIAKMDASL
ncbi:MAG: caspase family protein [Spirochaetales bacterium]